MNAFEKTINLADNKSISIDFKRYHNCLLVCDDSDLKNKINFPDMVINKDNDGDLWILEGIKRSRFQNSRNKNSKFIIVFIDISNMKISSMHMVHILLATTWGAGIGILLFADHMSWEKYQDISPLIPYRVLIDEKGDYDDKILGPKDIEIII